jgi:hypothetical protein
MSSVGPRAHPGREELTRLAIRVAEHGLCAGSPTPDAWFPAQALSPSSRQRAAANQRARELCGGCSVITECLALAVARGEEHGIWGGTTPLQRAALRASKPESDDAAEAPRWPTGDVA